MSDTRQRPVSAGMALRALAAVLVGASAVAAEPAASLAPGVTIIREDATGIVLEYAPPAPSLAATEDPTGGVRVVVEGHRSLAAPGEPDLPTTSVLFGVPPAGEPRLTIESVAYAPLGRAVVAPAPAVAGAEAPTRVDFVPDARVYASDLPFPRAAAALGAAHAMGPVRAAALTLSPVRWNPRTRELESVTRLRARVDFPASPSAGRAPAAPALRERTEALLRSALVNFETARAFVVPRPAAKAGGTAARGPADSFASSDTWVRVTTRTKGLHRVRYEDLVSAGVPDPGQAMGSTATLRLYNGGGIDLPEYPLDPRPDWMKQIPILVQDGGVQGLFEPGDAILFYAIGLAGFLDEFDPSLPSDVHFASRFADDNVYWLTWGGTFAEPATRLTAQPIDGTVVPGSGATVATKFLHRTHEEQDIVEDFTRFGEDGLFWADFRGGSAERRFISSSPGAVTADSATLKIRLYGHFQTDVANGGTYSGNATWNSVAVGDTNFRWDDQLGNTGGVKAPFDFQHTGLFASGGADTLQIRILDTFRRDVYLAWFELAYQRRYDALGQGTFLFTSPSDTGLVHYDIAGFSGSAPHLIDVTDLFGARLVTGWDLQANTLSFEVRESTRRRYALWDDAAALAPASVSLFPIQDLRDPSLTADYVLIAADEFLSASGPLLTHRAREFDARSVPLSQVFAQFGWGISQPAAVRDFLRYAVNNWDGGQGPGVGVVPDFALFVGDATKDYRGLRQSPNRNIFPAYYRIDQQGFQNDTFATDDWYAYLDGDSLADIAVGRFPTQNASQVQTIVSKILDYETNPELGEWRSRVIFVADDEMKGCPDREILSICWDRFFLQQHLEDVEASAALVSEAFDHVKVYLMEFPFGNAAEKPAAKQAYLTELKKGGLISHYAGHGGFDKMADENVFFQSDADATKIQNGRRYFIFTAYSCSIGTFDLTAQSSIAELLMRSPGGGSIASFASAAPAFSGPSRELAVEFTTNAMVPPASGAAPRIGEAILLAKRTLATISALTNNEKYMHLGDPALRIGIPEKEVRVDPHPGFFSAALDSVSGSVIDADSVATWFTGTASVLVSGSADTSGYTYFPPPLGLRRRARYELIGGTLYRGDVPVVNGRWTATFYVPSDLRQGNRGRVRAYVTNGVTDGLGVADSILTTRRSVTDSSDVDGPVIAAAFDGRAYRPGITLLESALMALRISDPHGINLQGDDDFFAIAVTIDEGLATERTANLTSSFQYDFGRYDEGELAVPFSQIFSTSVPLGPHTLLIRASDNLNNRTELAADVILVGAEPTFKVSNPLNFPNPFSDRTCIQYSLSQNAEVTIRIFTVNGRLVREIKNIASQTGTTDCSDPLLTWDGRDHEGDEVANGVYFFKVLAKSVDSNQESEAVGKALVMKR